MTRAPFYTHLTSAVFPFAPIGETATALRSDLGMPKVDASLTANHDALAARCDAR